MSVSSRLLRQRLHPHAVQDARDTTQFFFPNKNFFHCDFFVTFEAV